MSRILAVENTLKQIEKETIVLLRHLRQGDVAASKQYNDVDPKPVISKKRLTRKAQ